ncbi:MAG: LiaF-related protein, partial [candidate division Zixibacteria bacterium]|nr:LiaF-related protein [candidate division Zixibacteria bacterium]
YNTEINFDIGACDAEFDFGGIALEYLEIDVGAAKGTFEFSKPNPIRLSEINIDAGASSIEMKSMGNANFDELNFSGGVGSFEIDLRGEYQGESRVDIEIGLGSAEIVVPKGLPVRIETEGNNWLSSIDFHNEDLDEIDDDLYESSDFDDSDDRLIISIEVGLGSVDLYWKN